MPEIHVLPDLLVNKIAAGEVVERPASVVKELLENAIDSGASHIQVAIEEGGKRLIRVADDGCGMSADDLRLAVTPHATSKLADEDDLYRIGTLGFRGEALASIGAVANLRIVSRPHDSDAGAEILVAGEQVQSCQAAGAPPGTSIEVRDLFFNVPARRKFLRTTSTEVGHVSEQFSRLALAHPQVGFELYNSQRVSRRLPADQGRLERIGALFGGELAQELIPVRRDERGLDIQAYAAPPANSKPTAAGQYIFVNGRYVRDRVINYAIREAYRGLIEHNRYPIVFLFLALDPAQVDVNVHPTKIEVRWQDTNLIRSQVLSALRETLLRTDLTPTLRADPSVPPMADASRQRIRAQMAEQLKGMTPEGAGADSPTGPAPPTSHITPGMPGAMSGGTPVATPGATRGPTPGAQDLPAAADLWRSLYETTAAPAADLDKTTPPTARYLALGRPGAITGATDDPANDVVRATTADVDRTAAAHGAGPPDARRRPTIQLHNTYLVTETDEGLIIIDQHALHERILYEQLRQRLTTGPLESQRLLLPETLEVTPHQAAVLEERHDLLEQLGIEAAPFGPNAIAVQAFPTLLAETDIRAFMRDLIDKLDVPGDHPHSEMVIHSLLDMMACKAAVKAGDPLTPEEIDSLIAHKDLVEKSSNCPHGRPTTLQMHLRDLERQFKRT